MRTSFRGPGALSPAARQVKEDEYTTAVPVNLDSQVVLRAGDQGSSCGDAFRNPLPVPLELHELKWGLAAQADTGGTVALNGIAVEAAIRYATLPLTASAIPLCSLSPQVSSRNENNAFTGVSGGSFIADQYAAVFGRVKFDEPVYLLPGEQLDVSLNHRSLIPQAITANISISGRGVRNIPRRRKLPYWAQWTPQAFAIDQAQTVAPLRVDSGVNDLVNRSGVKLDIRRIVGRILLSSVGAIADSPDARDIVTLMARSNQGIAIVKDATPFGAVFSPPSFSLEAPFEMQPNDYILVSLFTLGFANAATQFKANPSIAFVGYRDLV